MSFWTKIAGLLSSNERRKGDRKPSPQIAAFFWTGGAPVQHGIRDISSTGLYLLTEERWYPGTVIVITLQKKDVSEGTPERSISVQSKAVRWGDDGVGLEFMLPDENDRNHGSKSLEGGSDRKALEKFLAGLNDGNGFATIQQVEPSMARLRSTGRHKLA